MSVDFSNVGGLLIRASDFGAVAPQPWRIVSYCASPTVTLKNLETGQEQHFGIYGLMAEGWTPLLPVPPEGHSRPCKHGIRLTAHCEICDAPREGLMEGKENG